MFVEAVEVLECPRCKGGQGLVAVVDAMRGRRVVEGYLGCPLCETRYPVREGAIDFGADPSALVHAAHTSVDAEDVALQLAALLGLQESGGGYVFLGETFLAAAPVVARMSDAEVLVLAGTPSPEEEEVTRLVGTTRPFLPIFPGRLRGAAVEGSTGPEIEELVRVLAHDGRLVVLQPSEEAIQAVQRLPVELLVTEERALVGTRIAASQRPI